MSETPDFFELQRFFFKIITAVYESEFPITAESIAYLTRQSASPSFYNVLQNLVATGYLQVQIRDGVINYIKPTQLRAPLLPLPYFSLSDHL